MKEVTLTVAAGDPATLAALLAARLDSPVDVTRGGVQLDGRRCLDGNTPVSPGMRLVVHLDPPTILQPLIVFEDDWLLVADKPARMPSQATRGDSAGALDAWAQARLPDARLVHRLDRDASGLILISQCVDARAPLPRAALDRGRLSSGATWRWWPARSMKARSRCASRATPHDERTAARRCRRTIPAASPPAAAIAPSRSAAKATPVEPDAAERPHSTSCVHLAAIGHPD